MYVFTCYNPVIAVHAAIFFLTVFIHPALSKSFNLADHLATTVSLMFIAHPPASRRAASLRLSSSFDDRATIYMYTHVQVVV